MSERVIKKWLEALESGRYTPTRYKLRSEDGYCPLGVLCDVVKTELDTEWFLGADGKYRFDGCDISIPRVVANLVDNRYITLFDLSEVGGSGYTMIINGQDIRDLHDHSTMSTYSYTEIIRLLRWVLNAECN